MTAESPDKQQLRVAILVADGFEQVELEAPRKALDAAGFVTEIVSPVSGKTVQGFNHADKGDAFTIDAPLSQAQPESYAALLLPGGVHNPDTLRQDDKALDFVRHFFKEGKPVAAICHGPWTLINAGVVAGRKLTSWPSIKVDLQNAGAEWTDSSVVVDQGLVTSRGPNDLPGFCKKIIEEFKEAPQGGSMKASAIAKLGELIKDIKIAMMTTTDQDGMLRSRPMATQGKRFDGTLWFFASVSSDKVDEIKGHRQVQLSYADPTNNRYVAVSGRAKVVMDRKKAAELWTPLVKVWFPKGLDDPDLGLMQVDVERAEYWDTMASGAAGILAMAKSLFTGRPYQADQNQHQTIELDGGSGAVAVKATDKAADKGTDKGTDKAADKGTDKAPDKAADKASDKGTDKAPDKAADKASDKASDKTPAKALEKEPEKPADKAPAKAPDQESDKGPDKVADKAAPSPTAAEPAGKHDKKPAGKHGHGGSKRR